MESISVESEKKTVYLKIYRYGKEVLIAICDCDLMGKRFTEGKLHIEINQDFFGYEKASNREVEQALESATIANFVGRECVEHAIKLGYVHKESTIVIDGVSCAQMVRI
jgi:hypothetical protein